MWLGGHGYGATDWGSASRAAIGFHAAENWTDTAQGAYITFGTTPTGSATRYEQMRISPSGNVGIGSTNPTDRLRIASNGTCNIAVAGYGESIDVGMQFYRARGTGASPSAAQAGDALLWCGARGYGQTGWSNGSKASMGFIAAENWTDAAQGTYMSFYTTPTGSATRYERMRISPSGNVGIGSTNPSNRLTIASNGDTFVTCTA